MSRNYELLRRAGKEAELFSQRSSNSLSNDNEHRRVDLGGAEEEVANLVQRVFVSSNSHAPRAVVFSSVDGNGSSEVCCRAGKFLAAQGLGSVCLVDANVRAPSLHQMLGVGDTPGLTDAAARLGPIKNFAARIADGNLWVVPPGLLAAESQRLFASDRLHSRMGELRGEFKYVLIDAPPVSSYMEAVLIGQMADGVVLVLEANSTRRETALMAKKSFEGANVKILGAILKNRTFPIPEALYRRL